MQKLRNNIGDNMGNNIWLILGNSLTNNIWDNTKVSIRNNLAGNIENSIWFNIDANIEVNIGNGISPQSTTSPQTQAYIKEQIKTNGKY